MSHRLVRSVVVLLHLSLAVHAMAGFSQEGQAAGAAEKASDLRVIHGVKPTLVQECRDASARIINSFRQGTEINSRDNRVMMACRVAFAASDVNLLAESPVTKYAKHIRPERFQVAKETSGEILAEFDSTSGDVSFESSKLRTLDIFQTAISAADALDKLAAPEHTDRVAPELVARARGAAERILLEFDRLGFEADFENADEQTLREFLKAAK